MDTQNCSVSFHYLQYFVNFALSRTAIRSSTVPSTQTFNELPVILEKISAVDTDGLVFFRITKLTVDGLLPESFASSDWFI